MLTFVFLLVCFFFSSRRRHTRCALVTGVQTCALPILEQEVETLKLYLEIEKMRFEERLRPVFDIDPAVARARLPSLLLQPLVENAIKYAVTPKEEGAEISVVAQPAGENVQIGRASCRERVCQYV